MADAAWHLWSSNSIAEALFVPVVPRVLPSCQAESPATSAPATGDNRSSGRSAASGRRDWIFAWICWRPSETAPTQTHSLRRSTQNPTNHDTSLVCKYIRHVIQSVVETLKHPRTKQKNLCHLSLETDTLAPLWTHVFTYCQNKPQNSFLDSQKLERLDKYSIMAC